MKDFNEKCAEYLGFKYKNQSKFWIKYPLNDNSFLSKKGYIRTDNLNFDSDWNWIMLVLEAILEECYEEDDLESYYVITDAIPVLKDTKQAIYNYITNNE